MWAGKMAQWVKGACHQAWLSKFESSNPCGRREGGTTPRSCPLTSTSGLWLMCFPMINKQKWDEKHYTQQQNRQETEISWLRQQWIRWPGRNQWGRRNTHKSLACDRYPTKDGLLICEVGLALIFQERLWDQVGVSEQHSTGQMPTAFIVCLNLRRQTWRFYFNSMSTNVGIGQLVGKS